MRVAPGAAFIWTPIETGTTGLLGTIAAGIYHGDTAAVALDDANVTNEIATSGIYEATFTAPATAGTYVLIASLDGTLGPDQIITEDLVVTYSTAEAAPPSGRDLCSLADVFRYVPAYSPNDTTNAQLAASITSESEDIHDETGRIIIPWANQPETRAYTINRPHTHARRIDIDDLASAGDTDVAVELIGRDGVTVATVSRDSYRPLYENRRQAKAPWEPITALEFPPGLSTIRFVPGQTLLVTGNFGFPMVPPFIVEACAKRVILRYASDVASAGTQLAAAIAEINLAGLFASSRDDVDRLKRMVMIA